MNVAAGAHLKIPVEGDISPAISTAASAAPLVAPLRVSGEVELGSGGGHTLLCSVFPSGGKICTVQP
jgi:hypothetical protein